MSRYTLLLLLNAPFVLFGILNAIALYETKKIFIRGLLLRFTFWGVVLTGLVFAKPIYDYLTRRNLTDSTPLSLADVVLVTGLSFSLLLCMRLYTKVDELEKKTTELHEQLSINLSAKK